MREVRLDVPRALLEPSTPRAVATLALVAGQVAAASALAAVVWANGWWALAPLSWFVGAIAATALFVVGHDCGHRSLLASDRAMRMIGHVTLGTVLYPFWGWKYSHDAHHRHTNLLDRGEGVYFDNAWNPWLVDDYRRTEADSTIGAALYRLTRWCPPVGSLAHMIAYNWLAWQFRPGRHRRRVRFSAAFTALVAVGLTVGLWVGFGSPLAVLHFWLLPALGFQAFMALYTFLHHTADDVTFLHTDDWNPFRAQMDGTINVFAPRWLSFLHLNIDVHIPHHVSTRIPSYHLRAANAALRDGRWGAVMRERRLTPRYVWSCIASSHVWCDDRVGYRRFADLRAPGAGADTAG